MQSITAPITPTPEEEFLSRLDALSKDSKAAAQSVYKLLTMKYKGRMSLALIPKLDRHAGFWMSTTNSIQADSILSLGRIYDSHPDAHRASKLLEHTLQNLSVFSRANLEARVMPRMGAAGASHFAAASHEPTRRDFKPLRSELAACAAIYKKNIEQIRHNAYAHTGTITHAQLSQLYENVAKEDLEQITVFPLRLHQALWSMYHNGNAPILPQTYSKIEDMLANPVGRSTSTLLHRHVVKETSEFLDWLETST